MRRFKRKRQFRRRLYSIPVLLILLLILGLIGHGTWKIWKKSRYSKHALNVAQAELAVLEERREVIDKKIDRLQTQTGIEEEIRSKFDVAREGEHVIIIVDGEVEEKPEPEKPKGIRGFFATVFSWFQ